MIISLLENIKYIKKIDIIFKYEVPYLHFKLDILKIIFSWFDVTFKNASTKMYLE